MAVLFGAVANIMQDESDRTFKFRRILILFFCILLFLSLIKYSPDDLDYLAGGISGVSYPRNLLGVVGARVGWFMMITFGLGSYFLTGLLLLCSMRRLFWRGGLRRTGVDYPVCILLAGFGCSLLLGLFPNALAALTAALNIHSMPGGVIGHFFCASNSGWLYLLLNWTGSLLIALLLFLTPLGIIWYYDWQDLLRKRDVKTAEQPPEERSQEEPAEQFATVIAPAAKKQAAENQSAGKDKNEEDLAALMRNRPAPAVQPASGSPSMLRQQQVANSLLLREQELPMQIPKQAVISPPPAVAAPVHTVPLIPQVIPGAPYQLPEATLLNPPVEVSTSRLRDEVEKTMRKLQDTLDNFGLDAEVVGNIIGPQVTLFEISPAPGVNIDRFSSIQNTICMALEAVSVRMLLPIPGRNLVGIEVPNFQRTNVSAYELLSDRKWIDSKMEVPLLLGKNISGQTILLDLARAPHLLIAGATGSGKSVCMNLLITSMLFKFKPDELKLIMADPKVVEFQPYSSLPHLIVPVITEAEKVSLALRWAINEMERRYRLLGAVKVRNLKEFNNRKHLADEQLDEEGKPIPEKLPFIVIIIDEIADVMLHAQKEVEKCLATIVAKSRAVGIHTIIATQRPDTKVITGTIKNNYPVRIAFQVPSQIDARTIMDNKGAESLLGCGDMLFKGIGMNVERIQGGWVDTREVENIVRYVSAFAEQQFDESVFRTLEAGDSDAFDTGGGKMYSQDMDPQDEEEKLVQSAIAIILRDRRPTISYLQRALKIGYNKAATLIDELEDRGIIGPQPSSGMREILVLAPPDKDVYEDEDSPKDER
ncbi:MAG: DNA translocase FtsK 4TM domain-containing protein [Lentisphaeria bacterium]